MHACGVLRRCIGAVASWLKTSGSRPHGFNASRRCVPDVSAYDAGCHFIKGGEGAVGVSLLCAHVRLHQCLCLCVRARARARACACACGIVHVRACACGMRVAACTHSSTWAALVLPRYCCDRHELLGADGSGNGCSQIRTGTDHICTGTAPYLFMFNDRIRCTLLNCISWSHRLPPSATLRRRERQAAAACSVPRA